jgi:hypothetical protein
MREVVVVAAHTGASVVRFLIVLKFGLLNNWFVVAVVVTVCYRLFVVIVLSSAPRLCEPLAARQSSVSRKAFPPASGLLRRFAPRNDGVRVRHCERSEAIQRFCHPERQRRIPRSSLRAACGAAIQCFQNGLSASLWIASSLRPRNDGILFVILNEVKNLGRDPSLSLRMTAFALDCSAPRNDGVRVRHCERSEAIQCCVLPFWIASGFALAMTGGVCCPSLLAMTARA